MSILFSLSLVILAVWLVLGITLLRGSRRIVFLRQIAPELPMQAPRLTIIAAARDEARHVRQAVSALLAVDYPELEVLLVNDRSSDGTGVILDELAATDQRLRVLHIETLPAGWLGKNHALWVASQHASGELLLFTDADVIMEPSLPARAVTYLQQQRLDHLTVTPEAPMPGVVLPVFAATFALFFALYTRAWQARNPKSAAHIGIGAFNMVRAAAYRQVGGHQTIRLRPDDDLKLGKIIKQGGLRQDIAYGVGLLSVEWYASVGELIRGLEKNTFAGAGYSIPLTLTGVGWHLLGGVWPYLAIFLTSGPTRLVALLTVLVITFFFAANAAPHGTPRRYALGFPLTAALFAYILLRSMLLTLARGGIRWRGTFYALEELKKNRI
jgi:cellulose synthase/poly-beta-1,6-N-acetylglucosamine synthase-like glycosyltransferase